jgi:hypothetical protein
MGFFIESTSFVAGFKFDELAPSLHDLPGYMSIRSHSSLCRALGDVL